MLASDLFDRAWLFDSGVDVLTKVMEADGLAVEEQAAATFVVEYFRAQPIRSSDHDLHGARKLDLLLRFQKLLEGDLGMDAELGRRRQIGARRL